MRSWQRSEKTLPLCFLAFTTPGMATVGSIIDAKFSHKLRAQLIDGLRKEEQATRKHRYKSFGMSEGELANRHDVGDGYK